MKVSFIGHASILIEAGGVSILSDPWWRGPCFGAQWWLFPKAWLEPFEDRRVDYVYISHGHHDHFHPGTLGSFAKETAFLVARDIDLASSIRDLGFQVIEVDAEQELTLPGSSVTCRIMPTHGDDTLMAVYDGCEVCVNLNDALHSAPREIQDHFVARLKSVYPRIDYLFCGYGVASHFPNCYVIPGKNREATAARRQRYFNRQWARLVAQIEPSFGFPFAADVVFLERELFWVNVVTHNAERPQIAFKEDYPESAVNVVDIAPGFVIEAGRIARNVLRQPVEADAIEAEFAAEIKRANRYGTASVDDVSAVVALLQAKLQWCGAYLATHENDWRIYIRVREASNGIRFDKTGTRVSLRVAGAQDAVGCDLIFTTRLSYLRWALTRPYGDEILFVGSGGIFEYATRAGVQHAFHVELMQLLRTREAAPAPRFGDQPRWIFSIKRAVRRLLGRAPVSLYDLSAWTVFEPARPGDGPVMPAAAAHAPGEAERSM
jgi:hypothetical protein